NKIAIIVLGALALVLSLVARSVSAGAAAVTDGIAILPTTTPAQAGVSGQQPLQPAPDSRIVRALPDGSVLVAEQVGHFVDNGGTQWVALWTEPTRDNQPLPLHVGVVAPFV